MKLSIAFIVSFLFLAYFSSAQSGVLDITKFGASPNGDITLAFTNAWKEACASASPAKIVIPANTYKMKAVDVKGPCKAPIEVQVDGTIQAPPNPDDLNGAVQWFKVEYMNSFTLSGKGTFDGQGATAWKRNDCGKNTKCKQLSMNFGFNFLNNSIIHGITSKDSKNFHVNVLGCHNFTFDHFTISAPGNSINTDGIHIGRSTDVKVINSIIGTGDDCVSIGDGSINVRVENVKCGPGHGISVGSLGKFTTEANVQGFFVKNCTLTNTDNGIRIKTWPDVPGTITVSDLHFEDITMVNVRNPVIIDQEYCPWNQCSKKNPSKIKISKVTYKNIKGTSGRKEGVVFICSGGVPCEAVELVDVDLTFNGAPATAICKNVKPKFTGKAPKCQP